MPGINPQLLSLLLGGQGQGAPMGGVAAPSFEPTQPDPLEELRKRLTGEAHPPAPEMQQPTIAPEGKYDEIRNRLADAISGFVAVRSRNPAAATDYLGDLRKRREARATQEASYANVNRQESARASRERAQHDLGVVEKRQAEERAAQQRAAEHGLEQGARAAERKLDEERQIARDKANLEWRQADREDEQAFRMRMQDAELKSRQDIADLKDAATTATERQIADAKELKETNARKGILALRDDIPTQLASGKTADQIRAKFHESLDSVHIDPGTPEHDAAMAYFGMKVEPLLKAQEDAISAGKKKGVEREAQKKEGQRKLGQARQVRRYDLGKV